MNNDNNNNSVLNRMLVECTASILFQSFNTVTVEQAFCMALGEAEIQYETDLHIDLTEEIKERIIIQYNKLNKADGEQK